jgi:hypothetical protein
MQLANDCASGAFSGLHVLKSQSQGACPTADARHVKTSSQRPFRRFLPPELLLSIFQFVYVMSIQTPESTYSESSMEWKNEDSLSPSLFPYAIASVCSFWRDVMLMTPAFWTRIVILVDARPTPLSMIECQLAWTRNLPIEVTITSRATWRIPVHPHEKARVASVMAIIAPQLRRCRKLRIDVSLSSSLPSFPSSFHGDAPLLEELRLECDSDDGDSDAAIGSLETQITTRFQCPALWKLAIDGRNFYNTCEEGKWPSFEFPAVNDLAISRFTGHPNPLPLQDILSALCVMPNLTNLRLADLALDPPDNAGTYDFISPSLLDSLDCEDIGDMESLEYLIEYFEEVPDLTLTRCAVGNAIFAAEILTLNGIDDDVDDFNNILRFWSGRHLILEHCPGFDDAFLETMCLSGGNCTAVKSLDAWDCSNFSVPALKRLVESRESADWCPALEGLYIAGRCPSFSPEDRLWFEEHLASFVLVPY